MFVKSGSLGAWTCKFHTLSIFYNWWSNFLAGVQFSGQWVRPLLPNCRIAHLQRPPEAELCTQHFITEYKMQKVWIQNYKTKYEYNRKEKYNIKTTSRDLQKPILLQNHVNSAPNTLSQNTKCKKYKSKIWKIPWQKIQYKNHLQRPPEADLASNQLNWEPNALSQRGHHAPQRTSAYIYTARGESQNYRSRWDRRWLKVYLWVCVFV